MSLSTLAMTVILPLLTLAAALAVVRLFRGPSLPDRVVALDLLSMIGIAMVAVFALAFDKAVFFDVAIVIAMVSFMATVAFAKYVEKRGAGISSESPANSGDTFSNVSPSTEQSTSTRDRFKNLSPGTSPHDPTDEEDRS